ncbi:MAG: hypothetical protein ABWY11_17345, partial [Umezawaea sp.]
VSVPRTGLDPAVRARIDAFAAAHGITVVEADRSTWPAEHEVVDPVALRNAVTPAPVAPPVAATPPPVPAPPATVPPQGSTTANPVVKDHLGRTRAITGDLFSTPTSLV